MKKILNQTVLIIIIFLFWLILSETGTANSFLVPSPLKVFKSGVVLFENGKLFTHIGISFLRVVYGFSLLTQFIAVPLSFLFYFIPGLYTFFKGFFSLLKSIPPLATVPLLDSVVRHRRGIKTGDYFSCKLFSPYFLILFQVFPRWTEKFLKWEILLTFHTAKKYFNILIPEALPSIITGLRLGFRILLASSYRR